MSILNNFKLCDLKQMNIQQLEALSKAVRETIIEVVSQNGGHLSSNLGVVELTIALHKVFDSPHDLFFFDVSHQTYTHKLLTERDQPFNTLRKINGLSGFSKRQESIHDIYEMGHSSTSISAGLGYLEAKRTYPDLFDNAIAIIGDASIVNGLALEALNYLGEHKEQKMIIIINDNDMSISKNVGALARNFNRIRVRRDYEKLHVLTPRFIRRAIQSVVYPPTIFNSFGFKYFEGIDGHDYKQLIKYLTFAKNYKHSIILHVITKKGKGYDLSENDQIGLWHSTAPFNKETGVLTNPINQIQSLFGETIIKYLINHQQKDKIRLITPGMKLGCGFSIIPTSDMNMVIDTGIAEENATVMAASMAQAGLIPFVFSYATFLERAFGEIIHDIARSNQHVIFCVDRAGIVAGDGDTHQGIFDLAYFGLMPNFTILIPSSTQMAVEMIEYAIKSTGPFMIRYPKMNIEKKYFIDKFNNPTWSMIKKGQQQGKIIITYGPVIHEVYEALTPYPEVGLVNAVTFKPIDEKMLNYLCNNYQELIIYEEINEIGSLVMSINNYIQKHHYKVKTKSICLDNTYLETGTVNELRNKYHVSINDLIKLIKGEEDVN